MGHSRLAPSKSGRVMLCAASASREAALPKDPGSEAANQGSNAHWVLEQALLAGEWVTRDANDNAFLAELPFTADGITEELIQQAKDCYDYVMRRKEELKPAAVRAEAKVSPALYTGRTDSDGTVDVIIVGNDLLEIVDLKTGGGLVEADASQLRLYALGVMAEYADPATMLPPFQTIRLTVFQPKRPGAETIERFVDLSATDLTEWARTVWVPAAIASDDPNAVGTPTDEGCKYCAAKKHGTCAEYKAALEGTAQMLFQPVDNGGLAPIAVTDPLDSDFAVEQLSIAQINRFLEVWPLIKARGKDIEERAFELLKERTPIPGFKLVKGDRRRAWAHDNEEMAKKFKNMKLTLDQAQPRKLMTPAQMMSSGLPTAILEKVKKHIIYKEGALTLVPENDKRANAVPAVEFQPVETPATEAPSETTGVDMGFLEL